MQLWTLRRKCVHACVLCGSLCGFVGVEGKQWQPLLQSHGYLELTWHFSCVFFRIIISQRPDIYLRSHRGASHSSQGQIFHDYFFQFFPRFPWETKSRFCQRAAIFVPMPDSELYSKPSATTQLFICHFLLPACVWDFTGTGALMWWRAPWAAWWRMGWRRTSNQTISAVPGANVRELREYILLSSSLFHISSDSSLCF